MPAFKRSSFVALLLLTFMFPTAWADQVLLKNGDRVTGSIVKKDGKDLKIKTDQFGAVTIPWDQIESITAEKPLTIVLKDEKTYQGTLVTTDGKITVTSTRSRITVSPADIVTLRNDDEEKAFQRLLKPGWGELWSGTGTFGFAGTAGNSETLTYTTGLNAERVTRTDKTSLYFNAIKASALAEGKNTNTAQAVRGGISYGHNVSPRFFLRVFNDNEYDRFQGLDLRFVIGGGIGLHVIKTKRSSLDFLAGAAYSRADYSASPTRNSAEAYWGDEYTLKLNASTSLTQSYRMFNDLTNTGDYRINFDVGLGFKIFKWLSWNLSMSDRYVSNPAPGRKTNDFLYTTGLGITFAR
jgi:putative salt-induced outer membrane protein YdiY/sporulation protein YlmC with PRC-barrel domain